MPAAGGDIAGLIGWDRSRRASKTGDTYGKGNLEGVVAADTASSATLGGSLTTTMALGIPGDSVMAVMIGSMLIWGLQPGPRLFTERPELLVSITGIMLIATVISLIASLARLRGMVRLLDTPNHLLWPIILIFCVVGTYATTNNIFTVGTMLVFGVIGVVFKRIGIPAGPIVLGLLLGPIAEENFSRTLVLTQGQSFFSVWSPVALILLLFSAVSLLWPLLRRLIRKDDRTLSETIAEDVLRRRAGRSRIRTIEGPPVTAPHVITAVPTAFRADGELDLQGTRAIYEYVARSGNEGAFVLGTTGEFPALSVAERGRLVELAMAELAGSMRVVVHVGAPSLFEVLQLVDQARAAGAREIAVLTPVLPAGDGRRPARLLHRGVVGFRGPGRLRLRLPQAQRQLRLHRADGRAVAAAQRRRCEDQRGTAGPARGLPGRRAGPFVLYTGADSEVMRVGQAGAQGVVSGVSSVLPKPFRAAVRAVATGDRRRGRRGAAGRRRGVPGDRRRHGPDEGGVPHAGRRRRHDPDGDRAPRRDRLWSSCATP